MIDQKILIEYLRSLKIAAQTMFVISIITITLVYLLN